MKVNDILSENYAKLCQQLGDLEINKHKINTKIQEIKEVLMELDKSSALFGNMEIKEQEKKEAQNG